MAEERALRGQQSISDDIIEMAHGSLVLQYAADPDPKEEQKEDQKQDEDKTGSAAVAEHSVTTALVAPADAPPSTDVGVQ